MNFQMVLFSGLGFLIFTGFCLFFLSKATKSNLSDDTKKALMLLTVLIITACCVFIFENYTADYIARSSVSVIK